MAVKKQMQALQSKLSRIKSRARRLTARTTRPIRDWLGPVWVAIALALVLALALFLYRDSYEQLGEMQRGIYVEAVGVTLDVILFGVVIALFALMMGRRQEERRQRETIDDFKKWNSKEARYRIAGAIRRLNRLHVTAIDFSGIELSNFSFRQHDILSISGSTFYGGSWGTGGSQDYTALKDVDFRSVNCTNVAFSKFNPLAGLPISTSVATFCDCSFQNAKLQGAVFRGANMKWSNVPPEDTGHWEELEDGHAAFLQTYYPPFEGADLRGASFEDVVFENGDFRGAVNLERCDFRGAQGLESCVFDDDIDGQELVAESVRED